MSSLVGDPLTQAINDLGKIEVKGALGLTVELAKFFVRKNRFVLTGSIFPKETPHTLLGG